MDSGKCALFRFFGWVVGEVSSLPRPNPALKGTRGYALACFPLVCAPAPLSFGVGRELRLSSLSSGDNKQAEVTYHEIEINCGDSAV